MKKPIIAAMLIVSLAACSKGPVVEPQQRSVISNVQQPVSTGGGQTDHPSTPTPANYDPGIVDRLVGYWKLSTNENYVLQIRNLSDGFFSYTDSTRILHCKVQKVDYYVDSVTTYNLYVHTDSLTAMYHK